MKRVIKAPDRLGHAAKLTIVLTAIVLTIFFAGKIIIPILFSGVFAIFLFPIVQLLERIGFNRLFATITTVLLTLVFFVGALILLGYQSRQILLDMPDLNVAKIINKPIEHAEKTIHIELSPYENFFNPALASVKSSVSTRLPSVLSNLSRTFVFFITCPIYIFFILLYSNNLKAFYFSIFKNGRRKQAENILSDINGAYANYIKGMLMVISIVAVLTGTGLTILGIDYAIFLGIFAGIMTMIPYLGVFVSAIIPIIIALITKDSYWYAGGVIFIFIIVQFLEGNVITPKIVGNKVGLNPLVVIIGIVVFGAIAGIAGMIITIPLLALFKVIAEHVPSWKPIKLLLKD